MAKILITAYEVREAHKAGRMEMAVPPGAIVTPQARDDARDFGIRLVEETACLAGSPHAVAGVDVPGRMTLYAGKA